MSQFTDLFEYNRWANALVLEATGRMSPEALAAPMPELGGSTFGLLEHLERVQANFFGMLTGSGRPPHVEGRTYEQVAAALRQSDDDFLAAIPSFEDRLDDLVEVAWFKRSFGVGQCLVQVATHSVQHRAGISAGIARGGIEPKNLDYIIWLSEFR